MPPLHKGLLFRGTLIDLASRRTRPAQMPKSLNTICALFGGTKNTSRHELFGEMSDDKIDGGPRREQTPIIAAGEGASPSRRRRRPPGDRGPGADSGFRGYPV
ncbi:hypothetical protein EVAR_6450_1 [Eumeta japonica]|uniref:Uncharacterized protein n=1 Tax=Eumeta variegata TaxID=151549 RepID=A0A4C1SPZ2_EUMVA|nr:hypothetical protein EVAR_6450_1 [Eumeta japonica]